MYTLTVRDHMMIAHSFHSEVFGPAQSLHGATYVVDVTFKRPTLDEHQLVIDIGLASEALKAILAEFNYTNLDTIEAFEGMNTTTEFMARVVFDRLKAAIERGELGEGAKSLTELEVSLEESHLAKAAYTGPL
ncbi:MAG: 6-carboxytetrahydropterin synthase [Wenzhouxiangella sp.]|nr:6-carboxytetrahydropterin synthase [Wenzhouxiangella sp.]MDR9452976.1 6-carboxytetrahydropterin synthase [Wenzhouxiangella sp.]